jgi:hypothetical protein
MEVLIEKFDDHLTITSESNKIIDDIFRLFGELDFEVVVNWYGNGKKYHVDVFGYKYLDYVFNEVKKIFPNSEIISEM